MIATKNIDRTFEVPYEGYTYRFPKDKVVLVEEEIYRHIKETWPMAFKPIKKSKNKRYIKVARTKTPSFVKPEPKSTFSPTEEKGRQAPTFAQADVTPPSGTTDRDGVGWYGEGAVIEQSKGKTF